MIRIYGYLLEMLLGLLVSPWLVKLILYYKSIFQSLNKNSSSIKGIHERSGRERIFESKTGHVLNDETQRKWIQSIKRLMTFAQTAWPPEDLSKLVG